MNFTASIFRRLVVLLVVPLVLTGCARVAPIYDVNNRPMPLASATLPLDQIGERIVSAGTRRGWVMRPEGEGVIIGQLDWHGRHSATVTIKYNQQTFSILHRSSQNLLKGIADDEEIYAGQEVIHRKYNKYVRRLEQIIAVELAKPVS